MVRPWRAPRWQGEIETAVVCSSRCELPARSWGRRVPLWKGGSRQGVERDQCPRRDTPQPEEGGSLPHSLMEFLSQALPEALDPKAFREPGAAFRPVMMWIWNANLDRVTLREQVAEMAARGIGGFFIHPMPDAFRKHDFIEGITEPYPGETFFEWVKEAAEAAREHGLFCWLYDEGGWPSGTLVGRLADGRPELAGRVLRVQCLEAGDTGAPGAGPGTGEEVVMLPAPGGRRLRFYASREGYPTDLMNPATTDAFLAATHDAYARCLGGEFGGLVPGVFTDEAAVGGVMGTDRIPWTPALPEEFRRRKGYDLLPYLPVLFGDAAIPAEARPALSPEQAARVRYDFGDVWTQLHADAFYGRMREWCREHGLLLVGHVGGEDDLIYHATRGFGHFFRIMRHLDVPGVDAIWHQLFPGQPHSHFSKLAGSAARVRGKPLALSETFAVYGYGLTYGDTRVTGAKGRPDAQGFIITADIANASPRDTEDVVQVYCEHSGDHANAPPNPVLCAFKRISLKGGEKKTISLQVDARSLMVFDHEGKPLPGEAPVFYVGMGQPDVRSAELTGKTSVRVAV